MLEARLPVLRLKIQVQARPLQAILIAVVLATIHNVSVYVYPRCCVRARACVCACMRAGMRDCVCVWYAVDVHHQDVNNSSTQASQHLDHPGARAQQQGHNGIPDVPHVCGG